MSTKRNSGDLKIQHVTPADGNVFADLGFSPKKAKALLKAADAGIASSRRLKESAAQQIVLWIKAEHLTQVAAAYVLSVSRPRVSDLINLKLSRFSLDSLVSMLVRVGKKVEMVVSEPSISASRSRVKHSDRRVAA